MLRYFADSLLTVGVVAGIMVSAGGSAAASPQANQPPGDCAGSIGRARTITPQSGEQLHGEMVVRSTSNNFAGTVKVIHSDRCQTAWAIFYPSAGFHGEVSVWNSLNQNSKKWVPNGAAGSTNMIDDQPSVKSCVGVQVYYHDQYKRWNMGFCW